MCRNLTNFLKIWCNSGYWISKKTLDFLTFHFLIYSFLALYIQPKSWQSMESFYAQILGTCSNLWSCERFLVSSSNCLPDVTWWVIRKQNRNQTSLGSSCRWILFSEQLESYCSKAHTLYMTCDANFCSIMGRHIMCKELAWMFWWFFPLQLHSIVRFLLYCNSLLTIASTDPHLIFSVPNFGYPLHICLLVKHVAF
jgi:hypothetical protein